MSQAAQNPDRAHTKLGADENRAIWVLLASAFVVILNETLMGVALPRLMDDMHITAATGQWLTTAFLLTMSVVIPITGTLIQRFNTRTLYLAAMALFFVGTFAAALAPGFFVLLIGRIIQAMGTAVMMPLLTTTVVTLVPHAIRGSIMGRISIVIAVAPALGPTVSGLILEYLSWRWIFIIMLPIVIAVFTLGARALPNVGVKRSTPIDLLSVLLSAGGFSGLVVGLSSFGESAGDGSVTMPVTAVVLGAILIATFVWRQLKLQRDDRALLDLRVFRSRSYSIAVSILTISMMALFGTLIVLPITMQWVLGVSTLGTGLMLLPGGVLMGVLGPFVGRLVDRLGVRPILVPGVALVLVGVVLLGMIRPESPLWWVLGAHLVLSVGLAGTFTPIFTAAFESVPSGLASHGSAILATLQQVAGAAGTALFITIMSLTAVSVNSVDPQAPQALASGSNAAFLVGGGIVVAAAILTFFLRKDPLLQASAVDGAER